MTSIGSWREVPIRELYTGLYDGPHATPKPSEAGPVFLGIGNLTDDGHLALSDVRHIAEEDYPQWTRRVEPREGDIVFTYEATLHRYAIIPSGFRGCLGRRVALIRTNSAVVDTKFLFYYFFSPRWRSLVNSKIWSGATVDRIPLTEFPEFPVLLPPLKKQRKIARLLASCDELISNNLRRIQILDEMARSIYREWFVHFRFPGHEGVRRVDSPLGSIPKGWEVRTLGDIAEEVRRNVSKGALTEPAPYVGLEHIPRRSLALDSWDIVGELGSTKLGFKQGEVLFGKIRPYFHKVCVAPFDGVCSADTIVLRGRRREQYGLMVVLTSSDEFVAHASATANGAKMPRAKWEVLAEYPVALPPDSVAAAFSDIIDEFVHLQQVLVRQIVNLRATRDLLLPRLMSGQLTLPEAEEATAASL